jgi:peptide/nickel transport system permease protein
VVVVALVTALTFFIVHILPGDLAALRLGENATPEDVAALREQMGLNDPILSQYGDWVGGLLRGDPGKSLTTDLSVVDQLTRRLPLTAELTVLSVIFSVAIGVPLGVLSAVRRGGPTDQAVRVFAVLGQAIPSFWLATLALTFSSIYFNWVPPVTYRSFLADPFGNLEQVVLPVLVAGYAQSAIVMRLTRSSMVEVLSHDYIRTARSKGLGGRVIVLRHALQNALVPIVTIVGAQTGALIGGMIIIETVFSLPGVGRLTFQAITEHDYTQLQFNVLVVSSFVVLLNLVVDLSYHYLDPRVGASN